MINGIFNVLKPPGMTSHDVVAFLRRVLQTKKIGHGGTLDPDAAGVLPVFAGNATRLLEYAAEGCKHYLVEITLGVKTDTGDDSGAVIAKMPVPVLSREIINSVLSQFIGKQTQLPPMYSAIKINGQKLYQLARKGIEVERKPRFIEVYRLELLDCKKNRLTLQVECSKGTYIRALGEDIAAALGTCGTMSFLLRTKAGNYNITEAKTLQEIAADYTKCVMEPQTAIAHLPELALTAKQAERITNGVRTTVSAANDGRCALIGPDGEFLGIGMVSCSMVQAEKIFQHYRKKEE